MLDVRKLDRLADNLRSDRNSHECDDGWCCSYLLHNHQLIHTSGEWVANTIYVIAREVHQHNL